jgi:hypothetical protein
MKLQSGTTTGFLPKLTAVALREILLAGERGEQ